MNTRATIWTERGRSFAALWSSVEAIEAKLWSELADGEVGLDDGFMHVVQADDNEDHIFLCQGGNERETGETLVLIDAATWEDGPEFTEGPFKGKKFKYPVGITDDEDLP